MVKMFVILIASENSRALHDNGGCRGARSRRVQKVEIKLKTKQADLRVLRNFYKYPGAQMVTFGSNVGVNLDATLFPNLPVAPADIKAMADDLNTKLAAKITGGTVETAAKNKAFDTLADALNSDANVVENVVGTDMEKLLATGYLPVSTNRSSSPLDDTSIVGLSNNGSTQVLLQLAAGAECQAVSGANQHRRRQDVGGGMPLHTGATNCAVQPCAGHDLRRAGAGHRRQHRGERLDRPRLNHVHVSGTSRPMLMVGG